ncbi:MAG TPA: biopolymer transporter ExbD [Saprospiraceae bacterium]|nr:biopolymer transporter ExbD [Saprospiraceae bacterium]HMQ81284.1 biopolymer transporter ExbD [Saprospiraceae bacterium]
MAFKKRNKVSAEFSMASLTDIIFLLLIFFMLTSTLVRIQPFDLPVSDSKTVAATSFVVTLEKSGRYTINNKEVSPNALEKALRLEARTSDNRENATITIVAEVGTPFENVVRVMKIANRLKVNAIIATQPKT